MSRCRRIALLMVVASMTCVLLALAAHVLAWPLAEHTHGLLTGLGVGGVLASVVLWFSPDPSASATRDLMRRYRREFVPPMLAYLGVMLVWKRLLGAVDSNAMASSFFDMSPALKRYYRRSALPLAAWMLLVAGRKPLLALADGVAGKMALALLPLLGMAWLCWEYMRFLRACDELERHIEQLAMAWSVGASLLGATAVLLLHDADAVRWSGTQVCAGLFLLQSFTYLLVRWWLHWRYR